MCMEAGQAHKQTNAFKPFNTLQSRPPLQGAGASSTVFKGFQFAENRFVAVKKINVLDRDTRHQVGAQMSHARSLPHVCTTRNRTEQSSSTPLAHHPDPPPQMMNDVKALCDARAVPGLVSFAGAYHMPDTGQIAIVLEYMDGGSLQVGRAQGGLGLGLVPRQRVARPPPVACTAAAPRVACVLLGQGAGRVLGGAGDEDPGRSGFWLMVQGGGGVAHRKLHAWFELSLAHKDWCQQG